MKAWILFFLGTLGYFLYKFNGRTDKTKFSFTFWLKDNWSRLLWAFILDLSLMIIIMDAGTKVNLLSSLPEWIELPGKLVLASLTGYGLGTIGYSLARKKIIKKTGE